MNRVIIGIDPGLNGGIGVITPLAYTVHDMPVLTVIAGRKRNKKGIMVDVKREKYNIAEVKRMLMQIRDEAHLNNYPVEAWLEKSQAMPDQGSVSNFNYGVGFGILQAVVTCLDIPLNLIAPVTWKQKIMAGQGKKKDAAVYRAQQLFPSAVLKGPKGGLLDGRAEALLIAQYGKMFSVK